MENGSYSVRFISRTGAFGAGVIVVSGSELQGGDSSYSYTGRLREQGGVLSASVKVQAHFPGAISVFGLADHEFILDLNGPADGPHILLAGNVRGRPSQRIAVQLTELQH